MNTGKVFSVLGMGLEAFSLYLIYRRLPSFDDKVIQELQIADGGPFSVDDDGTKEGQIDILWLIGFSLIFQVIGTLLS
jgi:hypothetical protein